MMEVTSATPQDCPFTQTSSCFIPGSSLACSGHLNCSQCRQQVWISCQPKGHILVILRSDDGKLLEINTGLYPDGEILQKTTYSASDFFAASTEKPAIRDDSVKEELGQRCDSIVQEDLSGSELSQSQVDLPQPESEEVNNSKTKKTVVTRKARSSRIKKKTKTLCSEMPGEPSKKSLGARSHMKRRSANQKKNEVVSTLSTVPPKKRHKIKLEEKITETLLKKVDVENKTLEPSIEPEKKEENADSIDGKNKNVNGHSKMFQNMYHCELCNKDLKGRGVFKVHAKNHVTPKLFSCEQCDMSFRTVSIAQRHKRVVHDGWKPFSCDICGKSFGKKATMLTHMNSHLGNKPFVCDICGRAFSCQSNLQRHMLYHTGTKRFACHICDKKFVQKTGMLAHIRMHTGEKPYFCEICGKAFKQTSGLRNHQAIHEREKSSGLSSREIRNVVCEICGKTYTCKAALYTHNKFIHKGVLPYTCGICGKKFPTTQRLSDHFWTHTGEKPFSCTSCGKKFNSRANKNRHEKLHTGERKYKCDVCGRSFTQKPHLTAHQKTHDKIGVSMTTTVA